MAENLCPMCSKPNAEDAEVCEFCGARLTPLVLEPGDEPGGAADLGAGAAGEGEDSEVPGWLARIRRRAEDEEPPPEEGGEGPDWLDRLRSAESEDVGPPAGEIPDWLSEEEPAGGEEEDWLARLRETTRPEGEQSADEPPAEPGDVDRQLADRAETGEVELSAEPTEPEAAPPPEPPQEPGPSPADREGLPDWLTDEAEAAPIVGDDGEPAFTPGTEAEGERPAWFEEFEQAAAEPEPAAGGGPERPEPPQALEGEAAGEPAGEPPMEGDQAPVESVGEPTPDERAELEGELDWESFDWDSLASEAGEQELEEPEGLGAPPEEGELPHVPALIVDEGEGPTTVGTDEFDLDAIELPDWLSEVGREREEQPADEGDEQRDLAPATIPSWLEAMRPVETFQPVVDLEPEDEQAVESVGPLAGLRGVLLAEPVVAKPRTSTAAGAQLEITERQYAQAELLSRIVDQEDQELISASRGRRRLPWIRWLLTIVLLIAVLLPPLVGLPTFATPTRVSRDLGPLIEVVNSVPTERPALLVFDYEPGYTAELEGVAGALLENLMAREIRIVTVSTRPTGPPLALSLVNQVGETHALDNGRNYLHLGYLSGGPTAVQLFAAAPHEAILKGFMLPPDMEVASAWELPILRQVDQLSDFGMVAVVASGTDSARTWAEQATPWLGDTPLVMVLSAGAEPLVRPYFESLDPQVDGILTGLPAAVAYEQVNGRPGAAQRRWNAFGSGVLAAELILLVGTVYGSAQWVLRRRQALE